MHYSTAILAFLAATSVSALPLNINLGAYSPALVVGDGEISFGGGAEAESLLNTLATSGPTEAATAASGITRAGEAGTTVITPAEPAAEKKSKRDLAGFNAALAFATNALKNSPGVELGTGEGGSGVGIKVLPGGAVTKRDDGSSTVTLLKIRSLGDQSATAKLRRARDVVARDLDSDSDDLTLDLDGDFELSIAEVKQ